MRQLSLALGLMAGLLIASPAVADRGQAFTYDSGDVGAGAIDSGVKTLPGVEAVTCYVVNDGAGARNFTVTMYAENGTTVVGTPTAVSVTAGAKVAVVIAPDATASGGSSAISARPTRRMRFQFAAGGVSASRVFCIGG
jgi:hypothetical protein